MICVLRSSVCWSGFLCFPNGWVLLAFFGYGGGSPALLPFVDEYRLFVDYSCIYADKFVTLLLEIRDVSPFKNYRL